MCGVCSGRVVSEERLAREVALAQLQSNHGIDKFQRN